MTTKKSGKPGKAFHQARGLKVRAGEFDEQPRPPRVKPAEWRRPGETAQQAADRRYRERHRAEARARAAAWRAAHPDYERTYGASYRGTPRGQERRQAARPKQHARERERRTTTRRAEIERHVSAHTRAEDAIRHFREAEANLDALLRDTIPSPAKVNTLRGNLRELYREARRLTGESNALLDQIKRRRKYGRPGPRKRK